MAALLDILDQPGYGSEMTKDGKCPHCGADERHYAKSAYDVPQSHHQCPVCNADVRLSIDRYGVLTVDGQCGHVRSVVRVGGRDIVEFSPVAGGKT